MACHTYGLNVKLLALVCAICLVVLGVTAYGSSNDTDTTEISVHNGTAVEQSANITVMETDGVLHIIPLEDIRRGGPPKDGIPSIDEPIFRNATDAPFMDDADVVIGLRINGDARAYPLFILVWHEIVNDEVGGAPVAITYCPLCYTSQVFERILDGEVVEFGTTGELYQSNLLMYDRLTDTYWSQALGTAVKGPLSGSILDTVPLDLMEWEDWKNTYPDTVVLSTDTGESRAYGVDPYSSYYTDPNIWFPVSHTDDRINSKEVIVGVNIGDTYKAYKQSDVEYSIINDDIDGTGVLLLAEYAGNTRVFDRALGNMTLTFIYNSTILTDVDTGSEWNYEGLAVAGELAGEQLTRLSIWPGFWFEWVAFHPETLVYDDDQG